VLLKDGASVETDIAAVDPATDSENVVVAQRSAQFEPHFYPPAMLYYSNVLCTEECGRIIQEIWRKNLVSGEAEQVTLVNAIARQPVVSPDGRWLYYSSNKSGNFHVWRLDLQTGTYERLTDGVVTDISPALDGQGQLYFIRKSPTGTQLMHLGSSREPEPIPLPPSMTDIRDLEIRP
jgi:Tol biopolymer transport system component